MKYSQIMFRGDFTYPGWNVLSNSIGFCAYHNLFNIFDVDSRSYVPLKMSIIGDPWTASPPFGPCLSPYAPNNAPGADSMVSLYAHELTEVRLPTHIHGDVVGLSIHAYIHIYINAYENSVAHRTLYKSGVINILHLYVHPPIHTYILVHT